MLDSHYVGHEHTELVPDDRGMAIRTYEHGELPVANARGRSLLEHGVHRQELLEPTTGEAVGVDVEAPVLELR